MVLATASVTAGDTTSPGKFSVYATAGNVALNANFFNPVVNATIAKGKKRRVLEIDVTLVDQVGTATTMHSEMRIRRDGPDDPQ
jgi:hypothetical protein